MRELYKKHLKPFLIFRILKRFSEGIYYIFSTHILLTYLYNNFFTFFPSNSIRIFYLKYILKQKIGINNFIHLGCNFYGNISTGNNCVIGRNVVFKGGNIVIGNNVGITAETYLQTGSHYLDDFNFKSYESAIYIKDRAWLGLRSLVLPGITIGEGSVLGAGSVLTKNIPDYEVFAGVPAKFIKTRSRKISYNLDYKAFLE